MAVRGLNGKHIIFAPDPTRGGGVTLVYVFVTFGCGELCLRLLSSLLKLHAHVTLIVYYAHILIQTGGQYIHQLCIIAQFSNILHIPGKLSDTREVTHKAITYRIYVQLTSERVRFAVP